MNADLEIYAVEGNKEEKIFSLFKASQNDDDFPKNGNRSYCVDLCSLSEKKIHLQFRYIGNGVPRIDLDNINICSTTNSQTIVPALYQIQMMPICNDADFYEWNFTNADISTSNVINPIIRFYSGDEASASLTITKDGKEATHKQTIYVAPPLPPIACYKQPKGAYLINTYTSNIETQGYLLPTDTKFQMPNYSLFSLNYQWDFNSDYILMDNTTNKSPEVVSYLASNTISCPVLEVSNTTANSTYAHHGNLYFGGNYLVWNIEDSIGGGNGKAMQGLGSNSSYKFEAIAEHYSRPMKPQYIGSVLVHFIIAQTASNFSLTVTIRELKSNNVLGAATVAKANANSDGFMGMFFIFNYQELIKIDEAFSIEITEIPNGSDDKLYFANQYFGINGGKPFDKNTSYFKMDGNWYSACDFIGYATSLSISPFMISPIKDIYLKDETNGRYKPYNSNILELSTNENTLDLGIISTFPIKEKPVSDADWFRCTSLTSKNGLNYLSFAYDAKGEEDHQAVISLIDFVGSIKEFIVYQGNYQETAIRKIKTNAVTLYRSGNKVIIDRLQPTDHEIIIYDICGEIVKIVKTNGEKGVEISLPSSALYIAKINGINPRVYKF